MAFLVFQVLATKLFFAALGLQDTVRCSLVIKIPRETVAIVGDGNEGKSANFTCGWQMDPRETISKLWASISSTGNGTDYLIMASKSHERTEVHVGESRIKDYAFSNQMFWFQINNLTFLDEATYWCNVSAEFETFDSNGVRHGGLTTNRAKTKLVVSYCDVHMSGSVRYHYIGVFRRYHKQITCKTSRVPLGAVIDFSCNHGYMWKMGAQHVSIRCLGNSTLQIPLPCERIMCKMVVPKNPSYNGIITSSASATKLPTKSPWYLLRHTEIVFMCSPGYTWQNGSVLQAVTCNEDVVNAPLPCIEQIQLTKDFPLKLSGHSSTTMVTAGVVTVAASFLLAALVGIMLASKMQGKLDKKNNRQARLYGPAYSSESYL